MADPLSIVAILSLAYAGHKLSEQPHQVAPPAPPPVRENTLMGRFDEVDKPKQEGTSFLPTSEKYEMHSFAVPQQQNVYGEPVQDFRDRPYISGKMNNLAPMTKELVGPGLGVDPNVPAYGGYQQLYRVNPVNVGEYKLTTLPGRTGPRNPVVKRPGMVGELTHNAPEKTAYLPERYPTVQGRAQGQGGALSGVTVRARHEHTKRPTNRSQTSLRTDGLEYAPAKRTVSALQVAQDPTRNKGDNNSHHFMYNDNPTPGIHSFHGAYTNTPEVVNGSAAIRPTDRRGKEERAGNPGRMNVRESAGNVVGKATAVRTDVTRMDGWSGPANGGWTQTYVKGQHQDNNAYKGNLNPYASASHLNSAKKQLSNNPLAHSLSG